ncbi:hypothetical protein IMSAGC022_00340 [Alistipes sp.]|jgi:cell division protein FtsB|nr:hypothetical protein IMSAGC022_00340 [Alistipes sp.]
MAPLIRRIALAAAVLSFAACTGEDRLDDIFRGRLEALDRTVARRETIERAKRDRIESIGRRLDFADTLAAYARLDTLLDECGKYDIDAALGYARRKAELAAAAQDRRMIRCSASDLATLYARCGNYVEAIGITGRIDTAGMDDSERYRYHNALYTIYEGMSLVAIDEADRSEYRQRLAAERASLAALFMPSEFVRAEIMRTEGDDSSALRLLHSMPHDRREPSHARAIWAYSVAQSHLNTGHRDSAIYYLAMSAECDLRTPVHEYRSLYELAALLFERGDVERAYEYINYSLEDAGRTNARINIHSINRLLPIITRSYNTLMERKQQRLNIMLAALSLLAALLAVAMLRLRRDNRRATRAERIEARTNEELKAANAELRRTNALLHEANDLKESYLCTYIDLCSDYIGRIDEYRRELGGVARSGGAAQLIEILKSNARIDRELKSFYERFDRSFLDLFPDFIERFNELLRPECRVSQPDGELLSTELRVFALIRLGITDSVKIAAFLRRSVTTVYNYRVKMRNAAAGDRDGFERRAAAIARFEKQ